MIFTMFVTYVPVMRKAGDSGGGGGGGVGGGGGDRGSYLLG